MKNLEMTINEVEYSCKFANKTKIIINKNWILEVSKEKDLKEILVYLANKVFNSNDFYNKQKIIALINLIKSIRNLFDDKSITYSLNLVVRNLETYRKIEKTGVNYILKNDKEIIVTTLIILAFSNSFNQILKSLYSK